MKRWLKWTLAGVGGLAVVVVAAGAVGWQMAASKMARQVTAREPGRDRDTGAHHRIALLQVRDQGIGLRASEFDQVLHRQIGGILVGDQRHDAFQVGPARRRQGEHHGDAHLRIALLGQALFDGRHVSVPDPAEPGDALVR